MYLLSHDLDLGPRTASAGKHADSGAIDELGIRRRLVGNLVADVRAARDWSMKARTRSPASQRWT